MVCNLNFFRSLHLKCYESDDFIQNKYKAPSKCLSKWINIDKWDNLKNLFVESIKYFFLAAYKSLEGLERWIKSGYFAMTWNRSCTGRAKMAKNTPKVPYLIKIKLTNLIIRVDNHLVSSPTTRMTWNSGCIGRTRTWQGTGLVWILRFWGHDLKILIIDYIIVIVPASRTCKKYKNYIFELVFREVFFFYG